MATNPVELVLTFFGAAAEEAIRNPKAWTYAHWEPGTGRCMGAAILTADENGSAHVAYIVVDKEYTRQGVGRTLVERMKASFPQLTAHVEVDNSASLALFRACGFKYEVLELDFYDDGEHGILLSTHPIPQKKSVTVAFTVTSCKDCPHRGYDPGGHGEYSGYVCEHDASRSNGGYYPSVGNITPPWCPIGLGKK